MTTLLLLVIYIAFIGLGIPDSLFGTAWPAIYTEFDLPISFASFVTVIISCGTIVSSMFRNCREIICIFLESMLIYVMNEFSDSGGHFHGT